MARAGIFISVNDIMLLTGLSMRQAYRELALIRISFGKNKHQHITIAEYAKYENISEEEVKKSLKR